MPKRIYQIAKELNISSDELVSFLQKQGFDVKGYMSPVDDKMLEIINKHYKHEREQAERQKRKREKEAREVKPAKVEPRTVVEEIETKLPAEQKEVEPTQVVKIEAEEPKPNI